LFLHRVIKGEGGGKRKTAANAKVMKKKKQECEVLKKENKIRWREQKKSRSISS
jgi:hypothetical protein